MNFTKTYKESMVDDKAIKKRIKKAIANLKMRKKLEGNSKLIDGPHAFKKRKHKRWKEQK